MGHDIPVDTETLKLELLNHLEPGETILGAMRRLGRGGRFPGDAVQTPFALFLDGAIHVQQVGERLTRPKWQQPVRRQPK